MIELSEVARGLSMLAAFWLVLRIELRWCRADIKRVETKCDDHSVRIRKLEIRR